MLRGDFIFIKRNRKVAFTPISYKNNKEQRREKKNLIGVESKTIELTKLINRVFEKTEISKTSEKCVKAQVDTWE